MSTTHFVLTGCARSGTTYTARVLTQLGISCTHEDVFGPATTGFTAWGAATGDSSWLAVPFLEQLPQGTVILHQVRDPIATVESLLTIRLLDRESSKATRELRHVWQMARTRGISALWRRARSDGRRSGGARFRHQFTDFLDVHAPELLREPNELRRAARYWIDWNARAAEVARVGGLHYERLRLEDLDTARFERVLALLGATVDPERVRAVIATVPADTNTRPGRSRRPSRAALGHELSAELEAAAAGYGYELALR